MELELTADIVAAFVANNPTPTTELPGLLRSVHATLTGLGRPEAAVSTPALVPAVPINKSIHDDYLISLLDGRRYKSLKRHIGVAGYTPERYRIAFGLSPDYPMVCAAYAKAKSAMAKEIGLGQQRRKG